MSITKAQAKAIAEGFLDNLGSDDKSELQPRETFTEILLIAGELIEDAQKNLNKSNNVASGKLSASITASEPELNGSTLSVDILMMYYGQFINKGVKGTRSGTGQYQFKTEFPSLKMMKALEAYISRAGASTRSVKKYKGYGKNESKNKRLSTISSIFALGRSIKQKGIKPTGFMDKAFDTASKKVSDRLGVALVTDITNSIDL